MVPCGDRAYKASNQLDPIRCKKIASVCRRCCRCRHGWFQKLQLVPKFPDSAFWIVWDRLGFYVFGRFVSLFVQRNHFNLASVERKFCCCCSFLTFFLLLELKTPFLLCTFCGGRVLCCGCTCFCWLTCC